MLSVMHSFGWYVILRFRSRSRSIGSWEFLWNSSRQVLPRAWFITNNFGLTEA